MCVILLQTLAYGGLLKYVVTYYALGESDFALGESDFEPHIIMKGGHLRKQVLYMTKPNPSNGVRTEIQVSFKEVNMELALVLYSFILQMT